MFPQATLSSSVATFVREALCDRIWPPIIPYDQCNCSFCVRKMWSKFKEDMSATFFFSRHILTHLFRAQFHITHPELFMIIVFCFFIFSISVAFSESFRYNKISGIHLQTKGSVVISGRIFLGMHSFLDVQVGLIIGLILAVAWSFVDQVVDSFIVSGFRGQLQS